MKNGAAVDQSTTYRVRGIPPILDRDETKRLLETCLEVEGIAIESLAFAPSGRRNQIATISFLRTSTPTLLSGNDQDEWTIPTPIALLIIDKHFVSFTPLNSPREDDHKIELVLSPAELYDCGDTDNLEF